MLIVIHKNTSYFGRNVKKVCPKKLFLCLTIEASKRQQSV